MSASGRVYMRTRSRRDTMPISRPPSSTTGIRLTRAASINRAAPVTVSVAGTVTAGLVISSAAVSPAAFCCPLRIRRAVSGCRGTRSAYSSLASRSASETTPSTCRCASTTGTALIDRRTIRSAISLYPAVGATQTTSRVITSPTYQRIMAPWQRAASGAHRSGRPATPGPSPRGTGKGRPALPPYPAPRRLWKAADRIYEQALVGRLGQPEVGWRLRLWRLPALDRALHDQAVARLPAPVGAMVDVAVR